MAKKTLIALSVDDQVTAGATEVNAHPSAVPNGKIARIGKFGASAPRDSDGIEGLIALQWGSGGSWSTVRAICSSFAEINVDREFIGDGVKTFRFIRINRAAVDKEMVAWIEGLIITP